MACVKLNFAAGLGTFLIRRTTLRRIELVPEEISVLALKLLHVNFTSCWNDGLRNASLT